MNALLDETHDPALTGWVSSANVAECDFQIQNLPFGVFREKGARTTWRSGVAIGDLVLDLSRVACDRMGDTATDTALRAAQGPTLNRLMAVGPEAWTALRRALLFGLRQGSAQPERWQQALVAQADIEMGLPAIIGDYIDFYTSIHHATNVGRLFRPDNPLLPNYRWAPIGYHGRAACWTTGLRATSRHGSTSRSARSSRKTSRPRCRRGS